MFRRLVAVAVAVMAVVLAPSLARADAAACSKTIGRETGNYLKNRFAGISRCETFRSKGKLPPTAVCRPQCDTASTNKGAPCRTNADCPSGTCLPVSDVGTSAFLARSASRAIAKIDAYCAGVSPLPPIIGPACDDSATTLAGLDACITDPRQDANVELLNADTLAATVYDAAAPITDIGLQQCQIALGKEVFRYVRSRYRYLQACHEAVARKRRPGPCPDAVTGNFIVAARTKLDANIRLRCTEAQIAATVAPKLTFGFPCTSFLLTTYRRAIPEPALDNLIACLTDATAAVGDNLLAIGNPQPETSAFTLGVAAGDATDTAAIFWTRFPDSTTGGFLDVTIDPTFASGVQTTTVPTPAVGDDGTVRVEVTLLSPYTNYYYRFRQGSNTSASGRLKTTPAPATTQPFRVGWTGDSNAFFRPFTVLDPLRLLNTDAWFFIGDTIYGDDPRADGVNAQTKPEYFAKYRENHADGPLRHMMESTGTYVQWDDHEVRNDFAGAVPAFAMRMAAGNEAFRKYSPFRDDTGDATRLYRSFKYGTLAEFFILDLRQYRTAKYTCCNNPLEDGFVLTDNDTTCTTGDAALPSGACTTALQTPGRSVLGAAQKAWLKNALLTSTATFKFIMNGPPITDLFFQPYDFWIGYPLERTEILNFILDPNGDSNQIDRIPNVVWLSTDLHGVVVSHDRLNSVFSPLTLGSEVVGGAIGMEPIFEELPASIVASLPILPGVLGQVSLYDIDRFNTALLTVTDTPSPSATIEFYDRSNTIIQTITFP
jgi:alkaline phosphatase D